MVGSVVVMRIEFKPFWRKECLLLVPSSLVLCPLRKIARSPGESIWFNTLLARPVFDDKIELRQELSPSRLSSVEAFGGHEMLESIVVCDDIDWGECTRKLYAPFLKGAN